jgi:hypothetical protein
MKGSLHVSTLVYVPLVPTSKFNACTHTLTTYRMYIDTNPIVLLLFTPEMALGRGKSHNTGNFSQYLYIHTPSLTTYPEVPKKDKSIVSDATASHCRYFRVPASAGEGVLKQPIGSSTQVGSHFFTFFPTFSFT